MPEPKNALQRRTRTYGETISQYNRLLRRFSDMYENGEYDDTARRREELVDRIIKRYSDNIVNTPEYLRTFNEVARAGGDTRSSRDAAWNAADQVRVPYRVYARNNR